LILNIVQSVQLVNSDLLKAAEYTNYLPILFFPPRNMFSLSLIYNKKQSIQIIVEMLVSEAVVPGNHQNRLIITGQEDTPIASY